MSEGTFLLIFGLTFGIPLIIAWIIFMKVMSNQMNHLNRLGAYYDGLQREREEKELSIKDLYSNTGKGPIKIAVDYSELLERKESI